MKKIAITLTVVLLVALASLPAWSQATTTVKGVCLDTKGEPIVGGVVSFKNTETGAKRDLKTDKKGNYFSIGFPSGKYDVVLTKDGKELYKLTNVLITLQKEENVLDFKLAEEAAAAQAASVGAKPTQQGQQPKLTEEQKKQLEAQKAEAAKVEAENTNIKSLNATMQEAKTAADGGSAEQAATLMANAAATNPPYPQIYAVWGNYELEAARKSTDAAARTAHYEKSAQGYTKALQICAEGKPDTKTPCASVAGYHNNLGQALANTGKTAEAVKEYDTAAQLDASNAGMYYFNEGAVLTNTRQFEAANIAFDKAVAADPTRAQAYCEKGNNLLNFAKTDPTTNKVTPAPGTVEALTKCAELDKTGKYADTAKATLEFLGQTIQTTYGTRSSGKSTSKKPPQ